MPALQEIATEIEQIAGIGHARPPTIPQNLFVHQFPASPDKAMAIMLTPGRESEYVLSEAEPGWDRVRFIVMCRDVTGTLAEATARKVHLELSAKQNETLTTVKWLSIRPLQPPFMLEKDVNERFVFAANYEGLRNAVA